MTIKHSRAPYKKAFGAVKIMRSILQKTFGGLSAAYYFRQLFFGSICSTVIYYVAMNKPALPQSLEEQVLGLTFLIFSALLYPYSRFLYENIIGVITGNRTIFVSGIFFLISLWIKVITIFACWLGAILVAPLSFLYLYFYHSKSK